MVVICLALNMGLLSVFICGKGWVVWRTEEQGGEGEREEEVGVCFESKKNMGSLELDSGICSGRRFFDADEIGKKLQLPKDSLVNLDQLSVFFFFYLFSFIFRHVGLFSSENNEIFLNGEF